MSTELTSKEIKEITTGGQWYFYDSNKNWPRSAGQWVSMELASKLSDKELDTVSIGKIVFTAKGYEDLSFCEAMMQKITISHNSTYGKGLDPEKYEECVKALEGLTAYFKWAIADPQFHEYKIAIEAIDSAPIK